MIKKLRDLLKELWTIWKILIDPKAVVIINISDKNNADKIKVMRRYGHRYIPGPVECKYIKTLIYYKRYGIADITRASWENCFYLDRHANVYRLNCNKPSMGIIGEIE